MKMQLEKKFVESWNGKGKQIRIETWGGFVRVTKKALLQYMAFYGDDVQVLFYETDACLYVHPRLLDYVAQQEDGREDENQLELPF